MKKIRFCFVIFFVIFVSWQSVLAQDVTAQGYYAKGIKYETQHAYEAAINMFTAAIERDANFADAYFRRGKMYLSKTPSSATDAMADFNMVITLDPQNAEAYYQRGLLHADMIYNEKARADMETASGMGHRGAMEWLGMETPDEKEGKYIYLGDYLPSGREPMVKFDFNKSLIKPAYFSLLDEIALVLKETLPGIDVVVAGYADSTGPERYNKGLSSRRAKAVGQYLAAKHGILEGRMIIKGYGEDAPIATNVTESGRSENRRVELVGVKK
jgi:outer membrane protein OmpA-like peptidoglycan-associated protein